MPENTKSTPTRTTSAAKAGSAYSAHDELDQDRDGYDAAENLAEVPACVTCALAHGVPAKTTAVPMKPDRHFQGRGMPQIKLACDVDDRDRVREGADPKSSRSLGCSNARRTPTIDLPIPPTSL